MNWVENFFNLDYYNYFLKKSEEYFKIRFDKLTNLIDFKDKKVLQQCCGTGEFIDYIHRQGFKNVYGFDIIKDYIEIGQRKTNNLFVENAITFKEFKFDLVLNINNSFGYFNYEDNYKVLENAFIMLKEGGQLILQIGNVFNVIKNFKNSIEYAHEDGTIITRKSNLDLMSLHMNQAWSYSKNPSEIFETTYKYYLPEEIKNILLKIGFKDIFVCNENGEELTIDSKEIIFVSIK